MREDSTGRHEGQGSNAVDNSVNSRLQKERGQESGTEGITLPSGCSTVGSKTQEQSGGLREGEEFFQESSEDWADGDLSEALLVLRPKTVSTLSLCQ